MAWFHDAELEVLSVDRKTALPRLDFISETGIRRRICFSGVWFHRLTEIEPQNVISRLRISQVSQMREEEVRSHLAWMMAEWGGQKNVSEKVVAEILTNQLQLCYLEPSAGLEAVVVAKEIEFTQ